MAAPVSRAPKDSAPQLLPPGLYERVIDRLLEGRLRSLQATPIEVSVEQLDAGDSHSILADHLRHVVRESLAGLTGEDRLARQVELVNRIVREIEAAGPEGGRSLSTPARRLLGVWPRESLGGKEP